MPRPTITAFKDSPDEGRGLARDMRVRWALEEVNQPYDVRLVTFDEMEQPEYLALQPFGQIPAYRHGDLVLFETGAIVLHIAENHTGLLPTDPTARARSLSWMFAALNTVEPPIVDVEIAELLESERPWYAERLEFLKDRVREILADLDHALGGREWLGAEFGASDILMITVLRRLEGSQVLEDFASLMAYVARGQARPAYRRAFAAQLEVFKKAQGE